MRKRGILMRFHSWFLPWLLVAANIAQAQPPEPRVTPVLTRTLEDCRGQEVTILTVEYPPGAQDPVHRHDAHGFIYVLEGSI